MKRLCISLAICCLAAGCQTEYNRQLHREHSQELLKDVGWEKTKALFEDLVKCTVTIKPVGFGMDLLAGRGTGVIISKDGYILTCAHVVKSVCGLPETVAGKNRAALASGRELKVVFSNGHYANASLVAFNCKFDLALLKTPVDRFQLSVELESGLRIMPGDVLVATVREGENESVERLITAGKVIVPYSALPVPKMESRYSSGLLFRTFGYAGMSGAPLFTRDGRFAGILKKGTPGVYGDGTSFMAATAADDIRRLLPDMKKGVSDGSYFTDEEFLAERERQNTLQKRLAEDTNPGFEKNKEYVTAVGVVKGQFAPALEALKVGKADTFFEGMVRVCLLDIYTARYMYDENKCAEIKAFFDRDNKPLTR